MVSLLPASVADADPNPATVFRIPPSIGTVVRRTRNRSGFCGAPGEASARSARHTVVRMKNLRMRAHSRSGPSWRCERLISPRMDVETVRIDDWRQIWRAVPDYSGGGWLYRGQRSARWDLKTSVERSCERRDVKPGHRREHEDALFREFRRSYHQYATHVPDPRAVVEWLSLMQHHGAPTRLLDFNYSIYIASYFALEKAEEDCAVWALRGPWALQESAKLLR